MRPGPTQSPIPIGQPRPLIAADLERLKQPRFVAQSPQRLRDSHHMIARLAAAGLRPFEIADQTGYSPTRVAQLLGSPAMEELVAKYRAKVDELFQENIDAFFSYRTKNMVAMERHIADAIAEADESGELIPIRTALAYSADSADRFGYGKKTQNLNINVDFAAQLERAIARSGKQIDSRVAVPEKPGASGRVHSSPTARVEESPRPLLRRRA